MEYRYHDWYHLKEVAMDLRVLINDIAPSDYTEGDCDE